MKNSIGNYIVSRGAAVSAFCAIALMPFSGRASLNLISNGSFEVGTFNENSPGSGIEALSNGNTDITGWTVLGGDGGDITWEANTYHHFYAQNGDKKLDLTGYNNDGTQHKGGVELSQTVNTVKGGQYLLTFWMGSSSIYNGGNNPQITVSINGSPATFVTIDGNASLQDGPQADAQNHWQLEQFVFTAVGIPTTISFSATTSGYDNVIELDNVSLTAVPEPSTMIASVLLLLPLSASAFRILRKKAIVA